MFRITNEVIYAVDALIYLASRPGEKIRTEVIAEAIGAPNAFLSKILHSYLVSHGLVVARRGGKGGVELAAPLNTTLLQIVEAVRGPLTLYAMTEGRVTENTIWGPIIESYRNILDEITLADLVNRYSYKDRYRDERYRIAKELQEHAL